MIIFSYVDDLHLLLVKQHLENQQKQNKSMTALYMDESNPLSIKRVTIDHVVNNSVNKVLLTNLSCMHCILHIRRFLNSRAQMLDPSSMNGDQVHLLEK